MTAKPTLVWLRRDLRLYDHAALAAALELKGDIQPVFIFDTDILSSFPDADDRRLSFIAATLSNMDEHLREKGGRLLVLQGSAKELIPQLAAKLGAAAVVAAEDYEPDTRARDSAVTYALPPTCSMSFVKDQLIFSPWEVTKDKDDPYKVYTPYAKLWRSKLTPEHTKAYVLKDQGRYSDLIARAQELGFTPLDASDPAGMLAACGYRYNSDALWTVGDARKRLATFIKHHATDYGQMRDMMAENGTSQLSPYLRFGLISVRECVAEALAAGADKWLSELIWREFYAMILYYFPDSARMEWNPKYRKALDWSHNKEHLKAWKQGMTGYPVVDAAMRQLLAEGWMHNRARMVVASFLTKHLRIDWRLGEAHFAQYLMDYDMASNVGGWQWAASTGTDAQPYFRVFNPVLQSEKFDPKGEYIRKYVPELREVKGDAIHAPWKQAFRLAYPAPIVDHASAREQAIAMFKTAG